MYLSKPVTGVGSVQGLYRTTFAVALAGLLLWLTTVILRQGVALAQAGQDSANFNLLPDTVGQPLPRIQCAAGYTATIYAEGLTAPDGLAFSPGGSLYVAEETAGRVSQIGANGIVTSVITGLANPEGIAFDDAGNLYVVEDVKGGRVVVRAAGGVTSTLVSSLDAPEGIVWVAAGGPGGSLYVTESNLEYALSISSTNPSDYRTHVTAVSLSGTANRILTTTAIITPGLPLEAVFWSYSGIANGPDGQLYFANELAGKEISGTVSGIPYHAQSTESLFRADPATVPASPNPFTDDALIAPEGPRFSANGDFPLYVAEEDTGGNAGRLSQVAANGSHTPFCTGFFNIEDVAVDQNGWLYVSEDTSGLVILIKPLLAPITGVTISGPASGVHNTSYPFTATVSPITATLPLTYTWEATDQATVTQTVSSPTNTRSLTWTTPGSKVITVTVSGAGGTVSDTHTILIVAHQVYMPIVHRFLPPGNWATVATPTTSELESVSMLSASDGWAVGENGAILHWNGSAWSGVSSPVTNTLRGVSMISASDGWAAGSNGTLLRWNGSAWTVAANPDSSSLKGITMISATDGWAVGNGGTILRWNGSAWANAASPVTTPLKAVDMVSSTDGWMIGDDGVILRWNGITWAAVSSPVTASLKGVSMISAINGWIVGDGGTILRWNGITWAVVSSPVTSSLKAVDMLSGTDGWIVGDGGTILHWNGSAWATFTSPISNGLRAVAMLSSAKGWATGVNGRIIHYTTPGFDQ